MHITGRAQATALIVHLSCQMHPYTLRNESPTYLAYNLVADPRAEYDVLFKQLGFDGAFTDFPGTLHDYFLRNELQGYKWDKLLLYKTKLG
jgi:glycerophosphoryl diester phosphodiesterase